LNENVSRFHLLTNTPCTSISAPSSSLRHYTVFTPSGEIKASHVIHCTNGHASHLLAPLRNHIVPVRGTVSAQTPPRALQRRDSLQKGKRLFTFSGDGYHYLAQLPAASGELILGGGLVCGGREPCVVDDGTCDSDIVSNLKHVLPTFFADGDDDDTKKERIEAVWSGIFALSSDGMPWVGRLPDKLSGRKAFDDVVGASGLAAPGEWLCGGYSGEGNVHAWLSGKALACMVLGRQVDWLPEIMLASEKRWIREGFGTMV
jgi:glycine/D-amino acid oxidase-like deaminating enzyme